MHRFEYHEAVFSTGIPVGSERPTQPGFVRCFRLQSYVVPQFALGSGRTPSGLCFVRLAPHGLILRVRTRPFCQCHTGAGEM